VSGHEIRTEVGAKLKRVKRNNLRIREGTLPRLLCPVPSVSSVSKFWSLSKIPPHHKGEMTASN